MASIGFSKWFVTIKTLTTAIVHTCFFRRPLSPWEILYCASFLLCLCKCLNIMERSLRCRWIVCWELWWEILPKKKHLGIGVQQGFCSLSHFLAMQMRCGLSLAPFWYSLEMSEGLPWRRSGDSLSKCTWPTYIRITGEVYYRFLVSPHCTDSENLGIYNNISVGSYTH